MRPHRLRVTAFGAFGGSVEVDFDDLAASGLFLLHGETGAGKTTLLDAIGFALYGRVPGERGKARRLRSDHAAAALSTEVELEATLGGRRLRITRKPEQVRPKRRGDGFTTEQARILVEEAVPSAAGGRDQQWRTLSTRAGEADAEIADLMGMSAEQFFQVVLLPQGQFAQFLQADAEGRRKLLQRLFGTDRFRAVEEWLAERRVTTGRQVAEAEGEIGQLVARVAEAAGAPMPDGSAPPGWAGQLAGVAAADADRAAARVAGCRTALDAALERQQEARRLADRQRRRLDAMRRHDELAQAQPRIAERRGELDAAQRAAEVAPVLAAADEAATMLAQARTAEERARAEVGDPGLRDAGSAGLRDAAQQRQQQAGQLDALRSLADQAATEDAVAATADEAAASLAAEAGTLRTGLDKRRRDRERHGAALDAAKSAAAELPEVRTAYERYRRAAADAAALVRARTDAGRHRQEHLAAREEAVGLREEASRLREARIDGMRAELAADLADGMPCPVCGSLDHPELCELRGERVTREQEEAATARAEAAARAAEAIGEKVTEAQTRVSDLAARLAEAGFAVAGGPGQSGTDGTSTDRDLEARAHELYKEASQLTATAEKLDDLQAAFESLGQAIADAETRLAEVTQQRTAELDKAQSARRRAAQHRDALRAHLDGFPDLDTALAAVNAAAGALTSAADAAEAAARAARDAARARDAAERAAADAGFPDVAAATAAQRDSAWRAAADRAVREHESSAVAVAGLLASADLDVPLDPPADVTGATQAAELASRAHDEAVATQARAQRKAEQLAALVPDLVARVDAVAPLAVAAAEARQLADLAAGLGANTLRMTLSSFVLAARLEEVAEAASQRLLRMTAGRYSLVHTDSRRGGGRSGLGLLACDAWTGVDRDTSTLSGGETFMASLALALGLADVVTEEAGGARIEALFVDEGFGSLDEETLEEVMNVLDGLREGGRCVGIVSHVSELRQRIPAQVRVRKTHSGSSVSVVRG
ncbi:MAG: SMC family ATPase [Streptosporangiaceae bacterium]|nr:SMC family ATPase [Streptosporangiaceae bacterium]